MRILNTINLIKSDTIELNKKTIEYTDKKDNSLNVIDLYELEKGKVSYNNGIKTITFNKISLTENEFKELENLSFM